MKRRLFISAGLAVTVLICTNFSRISALDLPGAISLSVSTLHAPDVPALPEENDFICADVNEDGLINVLDVISMVNYIMGGNPSPFNMEAADINADEGINVLDIIFLVNIIMQLEGMPCGCVAPVTYEGTIYTTVQIGDQCWFRKNLNVGTMINSNQGGPLQTDNDIIEKYCCGNTVINCEEYGGLYEWKEAMQYVTDEGAQGICPEGWHIPSDGEWTTLTDFLGGEYVAGGKMKSTGTFEDGTGLWNAPNEGATNESGFTGDPGGVRGYYYGDFYNFYAQGSFWSSTQASSEKAWNRELDFGWADATRASSYKDYGLSVRCMKDE